MTTPRGNSHFLKCFFENIQTRGLSYAQLRPLILLKFLQTGLGDAQILSRIGYQKICSSSQ